MLFSLVRQIFFSYHHTDPLPLLDILESDLMNVVEKHIKTMKCGSASEVLHVVYDSMM